MRFPTRSCLTTLTLSATALLFTACSSENSSTEVTSSSSSTNSATSTQKKSAALSELIVDTSLTPEGFEYTPPAQEGEPSLSEILTAGGAEEGLPIADSIFEPSQCEGVAIDSLTILDWMMEPTDTTATAGYSSIANASDAVFVNITSVPVDPQIYPASLSECTEFTRSTAESADQGAMRYSTLPADITVDGAEVLVSANVTLNDVSLNNAALSGEAIGQSITMVTATTDGITFTVAAPDTVDVDLITTIANEQAKRISASHS
ncbi:hypothetical protein [Corynebacterium pacaense]|uniref:hypothetical protein n=1 Tax=Corynebacterium pacaense TaxID=1816684 RepID=UPI0011781906|nr:hypothetical protein [Corynebacterium pacaense]